jgi:hypothetical protein
MTADDGTEWLRWPIVEGVNPMIVMAFKVFGICRHMYDCFLIRKTGACSFISFLKTTCHASHAESQTALATETEAEGAENVESMGHNRCIVFLY